MFCCRILNSKRVGFYNWCKTNTSTVGDGYSSPVSPVSPASSDKIDLYEDEPLALVVPSKRRLSDLETSFKNEINKMYHDRPVLINNATNNNNNNNIIINNNNNNNHNNNNNKNDNNNDNNDNNCFSKNNISFLHLTMLRTVLVMVTKLIITINIIVSLLIRISVKMVLIRIIIVMTVSFQMIGTIIPNKHYRWKKR